MQKRKRKLAAETEWGRGKRSPRSFLWSSVFFFLSLVNLEMVFCKEAILESWIHLEVSRYQLK